MEKKAVTVVLSVFFTALGIGGYHAYRYIMEFDQRRQGAIACLIIIVLIIMIYNFMMWLVNKATNL